MAEDTTPGATPELPQPVADPDAQTTVNDFLDYTEFLPSDLVRSLRLVGDLDAAYHEATAEVHELTKIYGKLPDIPGGERPDPVALRKQISIAVDKAIYCRESAFAEASRVHEVSERHARRLSIIRKKLEALPKPPSRDPTPVPVSPQAARSLNRPYDRPPRLYLHFDRHGAASTGRARDRNRKSTGRGRAHSPDDSSGSESVDSETRSNLDLTPGKLKRPKDKTARPPKPSRPRPSGPAPISTSSALAMLTPPPPDAKPGSKYAPWFKLTEYEMAVLRKLMKKNALWTPSDTMIRRELEKKGRGHTHYEAEKARCEAAGEEMLDEEPHKQSSATQPTAEAIPAPATNGDTATTPVEQPRDPLKEETSTFNKGMKLNEAKEAKRVKRESQREQAMRDAQELEEATQKIKAAAEGLKVLEFPADTVNSTPRRPSVARGNKRKRESSSGATVDTPTVAGSEASQATQDSGTRQPDAKRLRPLTTLNLNLTLNTAPTSPGQPSAPLQTGVSTTSRTATSVGPSPLTVLPAQLLSSNPPPPPEPSATTVPIPVAPSGSTSPKEIPERQNSAAPSPGITPTLPSPQRTKAPSPPSIASELAPVPQQDQLPQPVQPTMTAASSRPRRESAAPGKMATPASVPIAQHMAQTSPTPGPNPEPESQAGNEKLPREEPASTRPPRVSTVRPRSANSHVPTPKAQSEELNLVVSSKARSGRRPSSASQPATSGSTRQGLRSKKPPPKGDVTSSENGQKSVTTVKRASGSKNKKKKKSDEAPEEGEDIDPNEPVYCFCDDYSYGEMISCDNNVSWSPPKSQRFLTDPVRERMVSLGMRRHDF